MPQDITLDVAGARVTLPAKTITDLWLERVKGAMAARQYTPTARMCALRRMRRPCAARRGSRRVR